MNDEYVRKYIEEHPYEFKQNIIALCKQMDKEDVYEWLVTDEREINRLLQENQKLKTEKEQLKSQLEQRDNIINKAKEYVEEYKKQWTLDDEVLNDMNYLLEILNIDKGDE